MKKIATHYDNLQVSRSASDVVIRAAYRGLCQKYHPDKNQDDPTRSERVMKIINEAYAVLSNPETRKEHDSWIAQQEGIVQQQAKSQDVRTPSNIPKNLPAYKPDPERGAVLLRSGVTLLNSESLPQAVKQFETAIACDWPNSDPARRPYYLRRAEAYKMLGLHKPLQGMSEYSRAGQMCRHENNFSSGIQSYLKAIELDPTFLWAQNNLAWLLSTCADESIRNGPSAIHFATIACRQSNWNCWSFLDTLAASYAENREFTAALEVMQRALSVAPSNAIPTLEAAINSFRLEKPIRQT